ncbi:MAG: Fpg/Nei family DNA glycosylase [Proteobacteria bacterium]|nr:Fpg/Nei family DNA glycosylase [Pseudomonadota bacterium]MCP4918388.1 Fpg/Nei family DNA glycosylase [Pseudomonadota bacterium]
MPELPEVEIMTRNLRSWLGPGPVEVISHDAKIAEVPAFDIERVWRRGKTCIVEGLDGGLLLHFRMTGKVVRDHGGRRYRAELVTPDEEVVFIDPRRFGTIEWVADVQGALAGLGPEPYPEKRTGGWWRDRFARKRGPIKPALLDQKCVAGLGNIAASEILWRAGVDPRTKVPDVTRWDAIADETHGFLHEVIELEDSEEIAYINTDAGARNPFAVYGREGEPCPRTGRPIVRIVQAGRSTFFVE